MKSFGTLCNQILCLATTSKNYYISKRFRIVLLIRPFHRLFVPGMTLTATLADLNFEGIVSLHLSHANNGTVDSHFWQDWAFRAPFVKTEKPTTSTVTSTVTSVTVTVTAPTVSMTTTTATENTVTITATQYCGDGSGGPGPCYEH